MFVKPFQSTTIPVLEQVIQFTQTRHNILSGNIANMDTPGYHARDVSQSDFQSRLREAIAARHQPTAQSSDEAAAFSGEPFVGIAKEGDTLLRHDDGNVLIEHEVTELVKNKGLHNLAVSVMVHQFRSLQTAISERIQ